MRTFYYIENLFMRIIEAYYIEVIIIKSAYCEVIIMNYYETTIKGHLLSYY